MEKLTSAKHFFLSLLRGTVINLSHDPLLDKLNVELLKSFHPRHFHTSLFLCADQDYVSEPQQVTDEFTKALDFTWLLWKPDQTG